MNSEHPADSGGADPAAALAAKTQWVNHLLNTQIPYFRCSDPAAVKTYYYLWSLYLMYFIEVDKGWEVLEPVLDRGRVAMAAEMMGCALEAFERTVAYLKEREQFGALIGSFQALQHRAAHMQADIELCRSVLLQALSSIDDSPEQLPLLASLAKAKLNELVKLVTNEAVQMHGGIGVTDELEIGFFLKRARVAMQIFGDSGFHRDRYATLCGY